MSLTKVQSGMLDSIDATALTGVVPTANGGTGSTAGTANFKNRLINGNMKIWQRGTSGTSIATSAFGPDRWRNYGGNALTLTQSTSFGNPQSLLIQANGTNHAIGQRIEAANIADLAGQTVTISYKIRADNPGTHKLLMYYAGAQDNWSGESNFVNASISYTSNTVTTITYTTTLPAQAANGISVVLQWYNGGATINLTAFVWDIQIEAGSQATNFDVRDYGSELGRCQRYYQTIGAMTLIGNNYVSSMANGSITPSIPLRASPTLGATGALRITDTAANYDQSSSGLTANSANQYSVAIAMPNISPSTSGFRPYWFSSSESSNRLITLSAEL